MLSRHTCLTMCVQHSKTSLHMAPHLPSLASLHFFLILAAIDVIGLHLPGSSGTAILASGSVPWSRKVRKTTLYCPSVERGLRERWAIASQPED